MYEEITNNDDLLSHLKVVGHLIENICAVLSLLQTKRETLEEKIIKQQLEQAGTGYGQLLKVGFKRLGSKQPLSSDLTNKLKDHLEIMSTNLNELLKVISYNLNFLEQYFEYDFANRLLETSAINQIQVLAEELSSIN